MDGQAIRKTHLADFFLRYRREGSREVLTQLVDTLVVEAEAARHGVDVPEPALEAAVTATVGTRREEVAAKLGDRVSWEDYIRQSLGMAPEAYRDEVRKLLRVTMRLDRLIRFEQIRTERLDIRLVAVPTEAEAREVIRKLGAGADIVNLARERSVAPLVAPPPVAVDDLPEALRKTLTSLRPGDVSKPLRTERDGRELWQVYRLVARIAARDVAYEVVSKEIEAGLERRPRQAWEYEEWAGRARARHRIEWSIR